MSSVGGDLSTLASLRSTFRDSQGDVEALISKIDGSLGSTVWEGVNAQKFRGEWDSLKATLNNQLKTTLNDAERDVQTQHNQLALATGADVAI